MIYNFFFLELLYNLLVHQFSMVNRLGEEEDQLKVEKRKDKVKH